MKQLRLCSLCLFFTMWLSLATGVQAEDSLHYKAAEELLVITRTKESFNNALKQTLEQQLQNAPHLMSFKPIMEEFLKKHMGWDGLKEDIIKLYMSEFTTQELREMIKFNKSPVGQKAIRKLPLLTQKGAELGAKRVRENINELNQMIEDEAKRRSKE